MSSSKDKYSLTGWSIGTDDNIPEENALTNVLTDRLVYACWEKLHVDPDTGEILDSWEEINEHMGDGSYKDIYSEGNWKSVNCGYYQDLEFEIVGIDVDKDPENNTLPLTWLAKVALEPYTLNSSVTSNFGSYSQSQLIRLVDDDIATELSIQIKNLISETKKVTNDGIQGLVEETYLQLWLPSLKEMDNSASIETNGVHYNKFNSNESRTYITDEGEPAKLWLRSGSGSSLYIVNTDGTTSTTQNDKCCFLVGFCTKYNPYYSSINYETGEINLTWKEISEITAQGKYKEAFCTGLRKSVNMGETYGENIPMEIVAFDLDEKKMVQKLQLHG